MEQLVRGFLLKELHGWNHETALVSSLEQRPALSRQFGFETVPDQSTLWRTWHRRFSADLQETIQECARTILIEEPFVDEPGTLAVLATLSAICVKEHPKFEHASTRNIQVLYDIRELYVNNLASLIRAHGDGSLQQDIADVLYSKEPGEDGPHPGRVCTAITEMPEFGDGLYLEIPMAAASRKCLVRAEDESSTGTDDGGEILTRVKDNHLYVPVGDFDTKYRDYTERAFKKLLRVQEEGLSDDQLSG